jgi:phenylacetate-CoA ligase
VPPKIFDISLKLNGFPIGEARKYLDGITAVPEKEYAAFTELNKRNIAEFHLQYNPSYKKLVGKSTFENWGDLPIMRKIDFQQSLKERLSKGYSEKNVFINRTSGSGGDPFVFAKDKFCHALIWANIQRRWNWYGIDFNDSFQARFYGMPLDFVANAKLRIKDFLSNRYRFNVFDFSDAAMEKMLGVFGRKKFDYINGYTSNIVLLAKYLEKKNLFLNDICPTLKVCIVTSEMLFEDDKMLLEERFQIPIVNEYGSAELDIMAFENPDGIWNANAETLFIEIVDDSNHVLPYGKEGRIIVTSLYNKAHPMIRYEVGDIGILDEKSTPKNPILKKLTGRTNDVAILPSGKISPGMTFYSITKKLFGDEGNVREFVIIQVKKDTFEIQYTSASELDSGEIKRISDVFFTYLEPGLNLIFTRKERLERGKSGKLKQFVSLINEL